MSDYQTVTVKAVDRGSVTIEVVESESSRALASIFDEGERRGISDDKDRADPADWLKIGAMLLLDEKARNGDISPPEDESPEPAQFVAKVTKVEATSIGEGDSENPIYRAVLRIDLVDAEHAKLFEVGASFGAVADPGGDFDEIFG